jgi:lipopolysaccharide export system permease protein
MKTIDRYLIKQFVPLFLMGLLLFVLLLQLIDLFANLWRYLAYDAAALDIMRVALYYVPKSVSYALPISLLFAAAYTFGDLYARNELIIIFATGIPLRRLGLSLLVIGCAMSFGSFYFEDQVVIRFQRMKNDLSQTLLRQQKSANESDIVVKAAEGRLVYSVDYYNDKETTLNGISIVERTADGAFLRLIKSRKARWENGAWSLDSALEYRYGDDGTLKSAPYGGIGEFIEGPETFKRNSLDVEELKARDAAAFIADLAGAGLPTAGALADYYRRYAFAVTPLVVLILSIAMGGRFRKNVLMMSLLASLVSSVIYYVCQMIAMMLAKLGYIPPVVGAWAPAALFVCIGTALVATART